MGIDSQYRFYSGIYFGRKGKLVDVYMAKFKEIFGTYPKSIGSWFIDAHTLGYMYDKYKIVASCNCKDQVGTDGYTYGVVTGTKPITRAG